MKIEYYILKIKELFRKRPLAEGVIFKEKPSLVLVIIVYIIGIIGIIAVWKTYKGTAPFIVAQVVSFFKSIKNEFVESILLKAAKSAYFLILIFIMGYHLKRELTVFTLTKKEIIIKKGLYIRKEIHIPLVKIRNLSLRTNPLGLIAKYGTIQVDTGGFMGIIALENVLKPKEKIKQILLLMYPLTE